MSRSHLHLSQLTLQQTLCGDKLANLPRLYRPVQRPFRTTRTDCRPKWALRCNPVSCRHARASKPVGSTAAEARTDRGRRGEERRRPRMFCGKWARVLYLDVNPSARQRALERVGNQSRIGEQAGIAICTAKCSARVEHRLGRPYLCGLPFHLPIVAEEAKSGRGSHDRCVGSFRASELE